MDCDVIIPDDVCQDYIGGWCDEEHCTKRHIEFEQVQREFAARKKNLIPTPTTSTPPQPQPQPQPAAGSGAQLPSPISPCSDEGPAAGTSEGISVAGVGVGGTPAQGETNGSVTSNANASEKNSPPTAAPSSLGKAAECKLAKVSKRRNDNTCPVFRDVGYCMNADNCEFEHPSDYESETDERGGENEEDEETAGAQSTAADQDKSKIRNGSVRETTSKSGPGHDPNGPHSMDQSTNQISIKKTQVSDVVNPDDLPDEPDDEPLTAPPQPHHPTPVVNNDKPSSRMLNGKRAPSAEPGESSPTKRTRVEFHAELKRTPSSTEDAASIENDDKDVDRVEVGVANVALDNFDRGVDSDTNNDARNEGAKLPTTNSNSSAARRDLSRAKPTEIRRAPGVSVNTVAQMDRIDRVNNGPGSPRMPRGNSAYEANRNSQPDVDFRNVNQQDRSKYWRQQDNGRGLNVGYSNRGRGSYDNRGRGGNRSRRSRSQNAGRGGRGRQPKAVVSAPKINYPAQVRDVFYCKVCEVDCGSRMSLESHEKGKKHQNNLQAQKYKKVNKALEENYRSKVSKSPNLPAITQNASVPVEEPPPPTPDANEPDEDAPDSPPSSPLQLEFGTGSPTGSTEPDTVITPNDASNESAQHAADEEDTPNRSSSSPERADSRTEVSKGLPSRPLDEPEERQQRELSPELPDPEDVDTQIPMFMKAPTSPPPFVPPEDVDIELPGFPAEDKNVSPKSLARNKMQISEGLSPSTAQKNHEGEDLTARKEKRPMEWEKTPAKPLANSGLKSTVAAADNSKLGNALAQDEAGVSAANDGQDASSGTATTTEVVAHDVGIAECLTKEKNNGTIVPMSTEQEAEEMNSVAMEVENQVPATTSKMMVPRMQRGWLTESINAGGHQPAMVNNNLLQPISNDFLNKKVDIHLMKVMRDMLVPYGGIHSTAWKLIQELIISPNMGMSSGRLPALEKLMKEIPLYNDPVIQSDVFKWEQMHPKLRNSRITSEEEAMYDRHYSAEELSVIDNIDDNLIYAMVGGPTENEEKMNLQDPKGRNTLRGRLHHQDSNYGDNWGYRDHDELITDEWHHFIWNNAQANRHALPPVHPPASEN